MRKITEFSVNYPITIYMIVLAVILLGIISFGKLGIDLFPDLNNPRIFIEIKTGEKPPEEIEKQYVENIESLSIRQKGAVQVSSICRVGSAQITVEYSWDTDMDEAFLELQKTLTSYSQNSEIDEFNITQHDPNAVPVMIVAVTHSTIGDMNELRKSAENYLRNELIRLEGIAEVKLSGQEESEVLIETNSYILEAHNLTTNDIMERIQRFNRNVSGGSIVEMGRQYIIKGVSLLEDLDDIGNIIVGYKSPETLGIDQANVSQQEEGEVNTDKVPVFLNDVATIKYQNKDPVNIVRINQERCIGLSIFKETKFNTVKAVKDLRDAFEDIEKALPGYEFIVIRDQGNFITSAINEVEQTGLIGILLAIVILYVFLRRIGTTFIISVAIPVSIIATFNLMYFNGLTINVMTLGGLALGAGMLVDNAVVVMENIFRNLESGMTVRDAAIKGTAEVGGAITASTITTIVVFLPIVYLHGASGELFKDQAWTVAFSLISSLFIAILVIPVLVHRFFKKPPASYRKGSVQFKWYPAVLNRIIDHRWIIIPVAILLVATSVFLIHIVGSEFMPGTDTREFSLELELPEGTQLERTAGTVQSIEEIIVDILGDELDVVYSQIGPSAETGSDERTIFEDENTASIKIILDKDGELSSDAIISSLGRVVKDIPDLEVRFIKDETALQEILGTSDAPVEIEIQGEDFGQIEGLTEQVLDLIRDMDELYNIKTSIQEGYPEIEVVIDRLRAGLYNVDVNGISNQLTDQLMGKKAGQFENEGEMKDITIKLPDISLSQLYNTQIRSGTETFHLSDLATIRTTVAPKEIHRRNQSRIGKITTQYRKNIPFDHLVHQLEEQISQIDVPPDYRIQLVGEELKRKESMSSLTFALLLSIILVYMVLASQFESLVHPFTILLTIPLAGVGAVLIFFILGLTLNIMAYIGIIMLAGIAVNDSIILVDVINQRIRDGMSRKEAIIEAGRVRIRPIVMTSITTILALLPLTFGFGESASLRSPLAIAVIGGLVTSTILTLIVIPCVYYVLDQLKEKLRFGKT
ncbi:MAG: efflux RND transporter permease subunit [Bacteroidales bacterium]|nr:MAG: efflux RND transporter permease subunit [Bacteroidales bacterium]